MQNVDALDEDEFEMEDDKEWLLGTSKFPYFTVSLILILLNLHLICLLYMFCAISLIWYDDDVEMDVDYDLVDEFDALYGFYEKFGFLVIWEDLIEYLESITIDPYMSHEVPLIKEFFFSLNSNERKNKSLNPFLLDIKYIPKIDWLFFKREVKEITGLPSPELIESRNMESKKLQNNLIFLRLQALSVDNASQRNLLTNRFKKLWKLQKNLQEELTEYRKYTEWHNVFLIGTYFQAGLYPLSHYDYERILLNESLNFEFEDYLLFNYEYLVPVEKKNVKEKNVEKQQVQKDNLYLPIQHFLYDGFLERLSKR